MVTPGIIIVVGDAEISAVLIVVGVTAKLELENVADAKNLLHPSILNLFSISLVKLCIIIIVYLDTN